jgi:predicted  nucleic acid-binding Zn-ribbon protein
VDPARTQPRRPGLNASPDDQRHLLELQVLDTRIDQIAHRREALPQHARVAELEERLAELRDAVVVAETEQTDIGRELVKAEGDVELVRQRAARDQSRLDSGQGAHKELESLQHELVSLAKRQSELEDLELEVMERLETVSASAERLRGERSAVEAELASTSADRDAALQVLDAEHAEAHTGREGLAAGLPPALVTLYDKVRGQNFGLGAAPLQHGQCQGCRIELTPTELARIRNAPADEVLRCEECRRILVRVPESGL